MEQVVTCIECGRAFEAVPSDFVYDDPMAGWHQDPTATYVSGYCAPCADRIAVVHHADHINGNWEQRNLEDEMWIWSR